MAILTTKATTYHISTWSPCVYMVNMIISPSHLVVLTLVSKEAYHQERLQRKAPNPNANETSGSGHNGWGCMLTQVDAGIKTSFAIPSALSTLCAPTSRSLASCPDTIGRMCDTYTSENIQHFSPTTPGMLAAIDPMLLRRRHVDARQADTWHTPEVLLLSLLTWGRCLDTASPSYVKAPTTGGQRAFDRCPPQNSHSVAEYGRGAAFRRTGHRGGKHLQLQFRPPADKPGPPVTQNS